MPEQLQPPILTDSVDELVGHLREYPESWVTYIRGSYHKLQEIHDQNVRLLAQIEMLTSSLTSSDERALLEVERARAETERVRKEAQAEILVMAMEKAAATTERNMAVIERDKALATAQPMVRLPTPDTSLPAECTAGASMRTASPPASESATSTRLSERLPDPDKFDGNRRDLRRFTQQVYGKMSTNSDRFPTASNRLTYVGGRLTGKAYDLILPKIVKGVPQFGDYPQMLEYLEKAFGDPDLAQNAQNRLYNLKQRNQDFSVYFAEFQRLALEGEMSEDALTPLLFQGISSELQAMLLHSPAPSRKFRVYAAHLQDLDNRFRQHQQQLQRARGPTTQKQPATTPVIPHDQPTSRGRSPVPHRQHSPIGDPMDLSSSRRNTRKEKGECFRCGSKSHFVGQCPEPDNRRTQLRPVIQRFRTPSASSCTSDRGPAPATHLSCHSLHSSDATSKNGARLG